MAFAILSISTFSLQLGSSLSTMRSSDVSPFSALAIQLRGAAMVTLTVLSSSRAGHE